MKRTSAALIALALLPACSGAPQAEAPKAVGEPAPAFELAAADGKRVKLANFRDKVVVLEWSNPGCPSVKKHFDSGNMQKAQAIAAQDGVVWLTVNSGAPGKQGYMTGAEATAFIAEAAARPAAYLLDPTGAVGRAYDATTTPQMFVVNKKGTLVYAGGIDDKPTTDPRDIEGARNHVLAALGELKAGKPVSIPTTRPYGCSVKYAA